MSYAPSTNAQASSFLNKSGQPSLLQNLAPGKLSLFGANTTVTPNTPHSTVNPWLQQPAHTYNAFPAPTTGYANAQAISFYNKFGQPLFLQNSTAGILSLYGTNTTALNGPSQAVLQDSMIRAARLGHTDMVALLLQKGADKDLATSIAMIIAAQRGNTGIIDLLLKNGVDKDFATSGGWTAMMIAALYGHKEVVDLLLQKGANKDLATADGWTAMMFAGRSGYKDVVDLLMPKDWGYKDVVERLLKNCTGQDFSQLDDWAVMMIAAQRGNTNIIDLLLQKGVDKDLVLPGGWTAMMIAAQYGNEKVVDLLLKNGADKDLSTADGWTAMMFAAQNGNEKVVALLLKNGADKDLATSCDWTATTIAALYGHEKVVKLLLNSSADKDLATSDSWTAMMIAAQYGYKEMVDLLLKEGADINAVNKAVQNAMKIAVEYGQQAVVKSLQAKIDQIAAGAESAAATKRALPPVDVQDQIDQQEDGKELLPKPVKKPYSEKFSSDENILVQLINSMSTNASYNHAADDLEHWNIPGWDINTNSASEMSYAPLILSFEDMGLIGVIESFANHS